MEERAVRSGKLRNFGSVTSLGLSPNTSEKIGIPFLRERPGNQEYLMGEGLRSLGFLLEVRIGNDAPTFNTAHLAGSVFLFRDAV
jgi:hypothetical protein